MDFKPTYKTGGTTSRKPSKNDRAMVSGVSSILRKIKDKKNRKEVAGSMVKQFNREGVSYNKEKFLKNSRSFQDGGTLPSIYTPNPYDPRIRSYNDSLSLYNKGLMPFLNFGDYGDGNERMYNKSDYKPTKNWGNTKVKKSDIINDIKEIKDELNYQENKHIRKNLNDRLTLLNQSLKTGIYPTNMIYPETSSGALIYKKPVQPIIYKPLKPMGIKAIPATSPFTPITSVNIPMRKEKPLPVVRHTTNYLEPDIIKHRNLDEGFYKEIREELPKPKVTPGPKEIVPKQQPRKSNPKVVYQNYKKGGTVKSKEAKLSKLYKAFKLKK